MFNIAEYTSKNFAKTYEEQLPKKKSSSLSEFFSYITGSVSIIGLVTAPQFLPEKDVPLVFTIFLVILISLLMFYTFYRERRKLHRYAESILYIHYINHLVRDYFAEAQEGKFENLDGTLQDILDAIANCFSLLTGKRCRVSLKELKGDLTIVDAGRDTMTKSRSPRNSDLEEDVVHKLADNTDFNNLWYAINGCTRYYLNNNLMASWKNHEYRSSSFQVVGEPVLRFKSIRSVVCNWRLNYKSTLVLPIRYCESFKPPKEKDKKCPGTWKFWGFLCVDCYSRGVFDTRYSPELGGAAADLLYSLCSISNHLLENAELKENNDQSKETDVEKEIFAKI